MLLGKINPSLAIWQTTSELSAQIGDVAKVSKSLNVVGLHDRRIHPLSVLHDHHRHPGLLRLSLDLRLRRILAAQTGWPFESRTDIVSDTRLINSVHVIFRHWNIFQDPRAWQLSESVAYVEFSGKSERKIFPLLEKNVLNQCFWQS